MGVRLIMYMPENKTSNETSNEIVSEPSSAPLQEIPKPKPKNFLSMRPASSGKWMAYTSILFVAFISFAVWRDGFGLDIDLGSWLTASPAQVFGQHQYWRLFSTIFVHADLQHLASNLLFFGGLAFLLNGYFGYWAFPVLSLLAGGLTNLIALFTYPESVTLVGASGVVYFMAAFWLTLYFFIERRRTVVRRINECLALTLVLLMPSTFEPHVSYRTHGIGYLMGVVFGVVYFLRNRQNIRRAERGPNVEGDVKVKPAVVEDTFKVYFVPVSCHD